MVASSSVNGRPACGLWATSGMAPRLRLGVTFSRRAPGASAGAFADVRSGAGFRGGRLDRLGLDGLGLDRLGLDRLCLGALGFRLVVVETAPELLGRLPHALGQLGELLRAEEQEHDGEDDQQFDRSYIHEITVLPRMTDFRQAGYGRVARRALRS